MPSRNFVVPFRPAFDFSGTAIGGALVYFTYVETGNPAPIFSDGDLTTAMDNPAEANSAGRFPEIYLSDTINYRVRIYNAGANVLTDTPIEDYDPYEIFPDEPIFDILATEEGASLVGKEGGGTVQGFIEDTGVNFDSVEAEVLTINTVTGAYFPNSAGTNVPKGATGTGSITGGSGGTNGTFALAFSGGNFDINPMGTFTVAGGAVTAITITGPGLYIGSSITAPTLDFSASSGLTGASATLTTDYRVTSGKGYWAASSDSKRLLLFSNDEGTPAAVTNPDATQISIANGAILAEAPFVGGDVGAMLTKLGLSDGDFDYVDRPDLSEQPSASLDVTDNAEYQFLANFTSPSTHYTSTTVGSELKLTTVFATIFNVGIGAPVPIKIGNTYIVKGRTTTAPLGFGLCGIFLGVTPLLPVEGGPVIAADLGSVAFTARGDGVIYATDSLGSLAEPGVTGTISGSSFTNEEVTLIYRPTTTTSGVISVYIAGVLSGTTTFASLPFDQTTGYLYGGARLAGTGSVHYITEVSVYSPSLDVPKNIFVFPNLMTLGGAGTESNPYETLEEAAESIELDKSRGHLDILLKPGLIRGRLNIDTLPWKSIRVRGATGGRTMIYSSTQISGAVWTQIGSSAVWYTTPPNYPGGSGGFITDVTSGTSEAFGLNGLTVVEGRRQYMKIANNTAYNAGAFISGSACRHFTGPYAGLLLIRCWGDEDPNAKVFEWSTNDSCLSFVSSDDSGWNGCKVYVSNIDLMYSYVYNLRLHDCQYELEDIFSGATQLGYNYEFQRSYGKAYGCIGSGGGVDNFHGAPSPLGGDDERAMYHAFWDCHALGSCNFTPVSQFGDGFSLGHGGVDSYEPRVFLHNCVSNSNGKDGIAFTGTVEATDLTCKDNNTGGVTLLGLSDTSYINIRGGLMEGNLFGLNNNVGAVPDLTGTINAERVHFRNNQTYAVLAYASDPSSHPVINCTDCVVSGTGTTVSEQGGTVNIINGDPLA